MSAQEQLKTFIWTENDTIYIQTSIHIMILTTFVVKNSFLQFNAFQNFPNSENKLGGNQNILDAIMVITNNFVLITCLMRV